MKNRVTTPPVDETLWTAVDSSGLPLWCYQQIRRRDVVELLDRNNPDWREKGWRTAKVRMTEIPANVE